MECSMQNGVLQAMHTGERRMCGLQIPAHLHKHAHTRMRTNTSYSQAQCQSFWQEE